MAIEAGHARTKRLLLRDQREETHLKASAASRGAINTELQQLVRVGNVCWTS